MALPYEWQLGLRYTRAGRASGRNGFISFISAVSVLGIALGVAALIIVLSVINGFQREVRDRMLGVVAHVEVFAPGGVALPDLPKVMDIAKQHKLVQAAAPFIAGQSLIARGQDMQGVVLRGIDPQSELGVMQLPNLPANQGNPFSALKPGEFKVVLGVDLARALGVRVGDALTVVLPSAQPTPAGVVPRMKQVEVAGLFESGHFQYDSAMAMLHLDDAARLFRVEGASGLRLKLTDLHQAKDVSRALAASFDAAGLPPLIARDWTAQNPTYFAAVQVEKRMLFIILTLIVAVAAFNLVSSLVMTVTDKRADIAILRTLGATPGGIMKIFVVQGAIAGLVGTLAGLGLGLLVAFNIDVIVPAIEKVLQVSFLPRDIYLISRMPSEVRWGDVMPITVISLVLAFLATLYPSWRASRVNPAEALRYE